MMSNDNFKKMTDVYQVLSKQHEPQSLALSYQPITYEKSIFKQMADDVKSFRSATRNSSVNC